MRTTLDIIVNVATPKMWAWRWPLAFFLWHFYISFFSIAHCTTVRFLWFHIFNYNIDECSLHHSTSPHFYGHGWYCSSVCLVSVSVTVSAMLNCKDIHFATLICYKKMELSSVEMSLLQTREKSQSTHSNHFNVTLTDSSTHTFLIHKKIWHLNFQIIFHFYYCHCDSNEKKKNLAHRQDSALNKFRLRKMFCTAFQQMVFGQTSFPINCNK